MCVFVLSHLRMLVSSLRLLLPWGACLLPVSPPEIRSMYSRFRRLDRGRKGTITSDDLQMIPELAMSPLAPRIVALFENECDDGINFKHFLRVLAPFQATASLSQRLKCTSRCRGAVPSFARCQAPVSAFRRPCLGDSALIHVPRLPGAASLNTGLFAVFDVDRDGFISDKDLMFVVRMMTGDSLTNEEATCIVVNTLRDHDMDGDGKLAYAEFCKVRRVCLVRCGPCASHSLSSPHCLHVPGHGELSARERNDAGIC
jgi:serine/threonine-protein phosphatase 2B regulatory subunit